MIFIRKTALHERQNTKVFIARGAIKPGPAKSRPDCTLFWLRIIEGDSNVFIPPEFLTLCEYFGRGFGGIATSDYYSYESMKSVKSS